MMGIPAAITAGLEAVKAFFGWKTQKEINRPGDQKREEVQQIRKEIQDEIKYNQDAVRYGVDPITGRVRYPDKDK